MLDIVLIGLNHKSAPVEIRECIAFSEDETGEALARFQAYPDIAEVILFSTCNRVEILMATANKLQAIDMAKHYLAASRQLPLESFENALYSLENEAAVRHVFRVASSLDSMMVGEPQILGQIKQAYRHAIEEKTAGVILNRLLHRSFFVAKRVRTETGIGDHAVSISYAAIELAQKIFGLLSDKKVLLIGAGEMAELAVEHLMRQKVGDIYVANRTFENAVTLAQRFRGNAIRFDELSDSLGYVDIIISSTGANKYILRRPDVKKVMRARRNRPLFFIDIAVPRDIDPDINRLNNAYVYDIDDLKGVIDENIEDRRKEAVKGERIVEEAVISFRQWFENLNVVPTIVALRDKIDGIISSEIDRSLQGPLDDLSAEEGAALVRMKTALVNKIMHDPTLFLKSSGCQKDRSTYLDTARKLFNLDPPPGSPETDPEPSKPS
jgi:glutamyl-tRNA reductase